MAKPAKPKRQRWPITEKWVGQHSKADGKDHLYFDKHEKGFGLRVNRNRHRHFLPQLCVQWSRAQSHTRGTITATSDRVQSGGSSRSGEGDEAGSQRQSRTEPVDPLVIRKAKRNMKSISDLADYYLHEHAEVHRRPNYIRSIRNILTAVIRPRLGHLDHVVERRGRRAHAQFVQGHALLRQSLCRHLVGDTAIAVGRALDCSRLHVRAAHMIERCRGFAGSRLSGCCDIVWSPMNLSHSNRQDR